METERPPDITDPDSWERIDQLLPYADPWTFPLEAFYDLYDILDQLLSTTTHTHLEGRRGAGKTVMMVKAYRTIHEQFLKEKGSPPFESAAIFVDLKSDVQAIHNDPPQIRALTIYHQILEYLLTIKSRQEGRKQRRFWGLEDFLDERPNWFRRTWARWHLGRYKNYLYKWDKVINIKKFQEKIRYERNFGGTAQLGATFNPENPLVLSGQYDASATRNRSQEDFVSGEFTLFSGKVRGYLERLLDAMQVGKLIIFLDEWSDSKIGESTQPYLYELLMQTFPAGGRVAIKIATITGSTKLTFGAEPPRSQPISLDSLATNDTELHHRLTFMLLRNLRIVSKGKFPAKFMSAEEESNRFPAFRKTFFSDEDALSEFLLASENLPRQMLLLFLSLSRIHKKYGSRISAPFVRMAARDYFYHSHLKRIERDPIQDGVFGEIIRKGSRVVDIELAPRLRETVINFVEDGILFRCDHILPDRYKRYYLCYPAESHRLYNSYEGAEQGFTRFENISIESIGNCGSYERPPEVRLSELIPVLFVEEKK